MGRRDAIKDRWLDEFQHQEACVLRTPPLFRPSGTFSRKGRRAGIQHYECAVGCIDIHKQQRRPQAPLSARKGATACVGLLAQHALHVGDDVVVLRVVEERLLEALAADGLLHQFLVDGLQAFDEVLGSALLHLRQDAGIGHL